MRSDPVITDVHRRWAAIAEAGSAPAAPGIRQRLVARARALPALGTSADPSLVAGLIQAIDALAGRADELADRLGRLEALVEEVVQITSEDLVHVRAALASRQTAQRVSPPDEETAGPTDG